MPCLLVRLMQYASEHVAQKWPLRARRYPAVFSLLWLVLFCHLSVAQENTRSADSDKNPASDNSSHSMLSVEAAHVPVKVPLDESKLWLPLKYKKHHLSLLRAATQALAQPRCLEVKRGSIDLRQSTPERAIYRFLCKQASAKTYTEMIEGVPFHSLVPTPTSEIACYELVKAKTYMMKNIRWLNDSALKAPKGLPERYEWRFDAVSVDGEPLKYSAVCKLNAHGVPELDVTPRRD